ncbi:MAG: hypothetical protein HS130_07890 [Deltaproteobacteria bacterium]|nr:hypothetical protein [Deltaproteobacteria bacterium]
MDADYRRCRETAFKALIGPHTDSRSSAGTSSGANGIVRSAQERRPDVSDRLLRRFRGLKAPRRIPEELKAEGSLGDDGIVLVKLFKEMAGAYLKERTVGQDAEAGMADLLDYLCLTLSGERVEKFLAVYMGFRKEIISIDVLHEGTINQTVVYPRKAIEMAFRHNARSVIFVHNHPSGDPTPSSQDRQLTRVLDRAASAVDILVLDHLIIGRDRHFSARENGWSMGLPFNCIAASP